MLNTAKLSSPQYISYRTTPSTLLGTGRHLPLISMLRAMSRCTSCPPILQVHGSSFWRQHKTLVSLGPWILLPKHPFCQYFTEKRVETAGIPLLVSPANLSSCCLKYAAKSLPLMNSTRRSAIIASRHSTPLFFRSSSAKALCLSTLSAFCNDHTLLLVDLTLNSNLQVQGLRVLPVKT
jgi:hypothetical protein